MNEKASVSKELDAKHTKILEGILKLPENRECADCRNNCKLSPVEAGRRIHSILHPYNNILAFYHWKESTTWIKWHHDVLSAPRWASVNLGIFICMQCSGIHRSLGVHVSKVRSTTLDTWLPDQVSFMQFMGNEKSNKHWEAELAPNFDRSRLGIEKFIDAKYVEKRWASKGGLQASSKSVEMISDFNESPACGARSGFPRNSRKLSLEESILANHVAEVLPPVTRFCWGSLDMQKKKSPPLKRPSSSVDFDKSIGKNNGTADIFSLLCIHDDKQNFSTLPPSSWATFD